MNEAAGAEIPLSVILQKIERLLAVEKFTLALQEIQHALASHPDNTRLLFLRMRAQFNLADWAGAKETGQDILRIMPDNDRAITLLGSIASHEGRHFDAERLYLDALAIDPGDPFTFVAYARLMYKTNHLKKAEQLTRTALRLDPQDAEAHSLLATILSSRNKDTEAMHHGRKGLALDPSDDSSHASLGYAYMQSGHPFKARMHFREALRLDPTDGHLEEMFLHADFYCRWTYLPMYHTGRWIDRMPGKQFTLWGLFVAGIYLLPASGISDTLLSYCLVYPYLLFVVYSWISSPLTKLWLKIRPPKW